MGTQKNEEKTRGPVACLWSSLPCSRHTFQHLQASRFGPFSRFSVDSFPVWMQFPDFPSRLGSPWLWGLCTAGCVRHPRTQRPKSKPRPSPAPMRTSSVRPCLGGAPGVCSTGDRKLKVKYRGPWAGLEHRTPDHWHCWPFFPLKKFPREEGWLCPGPAGHPRDHRTTCGTARHGPPSCPCPLCLSGAGINLWVSAAGVGPRSSCSAGALLGGCGLRADPRRAERPAEVWVKGARALFSRPACTVSGLK